MGKVGRRVTWCTGSLPLDMDQLQISAAEISRKKQKVFCFLLGTVVFVFITWMTAKLENALLVAGRLMLKLSSMLSRLSPCRLSSCLCMHVWMCEDPSVLHNLECTYIAPLHSKGRRSFFIHPSGVQTCLASCLPRLPHNEALDG